MGIDCRMCSSSSVRRWGQRDDRFWVECVDCGLIFPPSVQSMERVPPYHDDGAAVGRGADATLLEPAFERLGDDRPLYMLDFGCARSGLAEPLRQVGHRVIGIDRTPPRHPHRDRLTGDILEMDLVSGQFDLVYAYRSFEHLPKPRPVLEELLRLTRSGGLVLILTDMEVPEMEARPHSSAHRVEMLDAMPPGRSFFRPRTFEKALEGRADELVDVGTRFVVIEARKEVSPVRNAYPVQYTS